MIRRLSLLPLCALLLASAAHADGIRDPMRPAGVAPGAPRALNVQTLRLEGVIGTVNRVAIINGRLVRAGESVGGVKILEVFANGVRFERAGKITTLTLPVTASSAVHAARKPEED
jgi:MSHA biogenesis protein MshK